MSVAEARDAATRKADTLALLATPAIDVWVATASGAGTPYLVPVSLTWVDERVVIAIEATSVTARNLLESGKARLAVGPTRDVVIIDAELERSVDVGADDALGAAYVGQADWDPRGLEGYVFVVLRPVRLQAQARGDGYVRFSVINHGRPLSEPEQALVFDPFFRRSGENAEGTGLGLAICRELAALHGGRVGVFCPADSDLIEFYFDLRRAA